LRRVYTERESALYRHRVSELAARFAAKEATSKVLGTGIRGIRWREMEILPNRRGKPVLVLHGSAAARARQLGLSDFSVSMTHSRSDAMAFVVAVKEPTRHVLSPDGQARANRATVAAGAGNQE
jgi:holo-[acyl-carrier protein] synthase